VDGTVLQEENLGAKLRQPICTDGHSHAYARRGAVHLHQMTRPGLTTENQGVKGVGDVARGVNRKSRLVPKDWNSTSRDDR
jgi:hypothetical protein